MTAEPPHGLLSNVRRVVASRPVAFISMAIVVVGFAGAWTRGGLAIDGPGVAFYLQLSLDHLTANGNVPYWLPEIWAGTPMWAVAPSFQMFALLPLAALLGPVVALKSATLALQVVGAWGAFMLARSLWRSTPAAFVAGVAYGVSPAIVSLATLFGGESSLGVTAATPWLVWSLRRGLREGGRRHLVGAGLFATFAILHQGEYAYGLALLCGCLVLMEYGRIRRGLSDVSGRHLVFRTALVGAVCAGAIAYWVLPFLALHKSFILSPTELLQAEFAAGIVETVGGDLGLFLHRSGGLDGVVTPYRPGLITHLVYLGWVPVAMTTLTIGFIARRHDEGTLSAVLMASAIGVWLSTGSVSLAGGEAAARHQALPLALTGIVAGLIFGGFVRRLGVRRGKAALLAVGASFFFVAPYLKPFMILRRAVPLLDSIRFPRLYVVAVLGLALGIAWPVAHLPRLLPAARRHLAPVAAASLALLLVGATLVDSWPYRSFYEVRDPPDAAAYRQASAALAARPEGSRVIPDSFDPRMTRSLYEAGADLTLAWPHPLAGAQIWRLTVDALLAPTGYAHRALGLSATSLVAHEVHARPGTSIETVTSVNLTPNAHYLPLVRAYDQALVVGDRSISPELAVGLAHRNVGVVTGDSEIKRDLGAMAIAEIVPEGSCERPTPGLSGEVAGEVGLACGMHPWLPAVVAGFNLGGEAPGSTFTAIADGLRGVSIWLYDPSGQAQMVLRELTDEDRQPGREVARVRASGLDEYGMTSFDFEPVVDSSGKRYLFEIECPGCFSELAPQMVAGGDSTGGGNLLLRGRLQRDRVAAFAPRYGRIPTAPPSNTTVKVDRRAPGRWRINTAGPRGALVVVAESHFPGWRARVDGRPAPVLEVDGAFVGVAVEAGTHEVSLDYHPPPAATFGRLITAGTLVAILFGAIRSWRRRARRTRSVGASVSPVGG